MVVGSKRTKVVSGRLQEEMTTIVFPGIVSMILLCEHLRVGLISLGMSRAPVRSRARDRVRVRVMAMKLTR